MFPERHWSRSVDNELATHSMREKKGCTQHTATYVPLEISILDK